MKEFKYSNHMLSPMVRPSVRRNLWGKSPNTTHSICIEEEKSPSTPKLEEERALVPKQVEETLFVITQGKIIDTEKTAKGKACIKAAKVLYALGNGFLYFIVTTK